MTISKLIIYTVGFCVPMPSLAHGESHEGRPLIKSIANGMVTRLRIAPEKFYMNMQIDVPRPFSQLVERVNQDLGLKLDSTKRHLTAQVRHGRYFLTLKGEPLKGQRSLFDVTIFRSLETLSTPQTTDYTFAYKSSKLTYLTWDDPAVFSIGALRMTSSLTINQRLKLLGFKPINPRNRILRRNFKNSFFIFGCEPMKSEASFAMWLGLFTHK